MRLTKEAMDARSRQGQIEALASRDGGVPLEVDVLGVNVVVTDRLVVEDPWEAIYRTVGENGDGAEFSVRATSDGVEAKQVQDRVDGAKSERLQLPDVRVHIVPNPPSNKGEKRSFRLPKRLVIPVAATVLTAILAAACGGKEGTVVAIADNPDAPAPFPTETTDAGGEVVGQAAATLPPNGEGGVCPDTEAVRIAFDNIRQFQQSLVDQRVVGPNGTGVECYVTEDGSQVMMFLTVLEEGGTYARGSWLKPPFPGEAGPALFFELPQGAVDLGYTFEDGGRVEAFDGANQRVASIDYNERLVGEDWVFDNPDVQLAAELGVEEIKRIMVTNEQGELVALPFGVLEEETLKAYADGTLALLLRNTRDLIGAFLGTDVWAVSAVVPSNSNTSFQPFVGMNDGQRFMNFPLPVELANNNGYLVLQVQVDRLGTALAGFPGEDFSHCEMMFMTSIDEVLADRSELENGGMGDLSRFPGPLDMSRFREGEQVLLLVSRIMFTNITADPRCDTDDLGYTYTGASPQEKITALIAQNNPEQLSQSINIGNLMSVISR